MFFLDYIAQDKLRETEVLQLMWGMTSACKEANIPLVGRELAQMKRVYLKDKLGVVGFLVGIARKDEVITGAEIRPGDQIIGLPSTGLHTNGCTLAKKICTQKFGPPPSCWYLTVNNESLGSLLMHPHRSYLRPIRCLVEAGVKIHGIAHITGGGIKDNLIRIIPTNYKARIRKRSWPILPIFNYLQQWGNVSEKEMYQVFNMGIGIILVIPKEALSTFREKLWEIKEPWYLIGEIVSGEKLVEFYEDDRSEWN